MPHDQVTGVVDHQLQNGLGKRRFGRRLLHGKVRPEQQGPVLVEDGLAATVPLHGLANANVSTARALSACGAAFGRLVRNFAALLQVSCRQPQPVRSGAADKQFRHRLELLGD